jgi:hypothetical protein
MGRIQCYLGLYLRVDRHFPFSRLHSWGDAARRARRAGRDRHRTDPCCHTPCRDQYLWLLGESGRGRSDRQLLALPTILRLSSRSGSISSISSRLYLARARRVISFDQVWLRPKRLFPPAVKAHRMCRQLHLHLAKLSRGGDKSGQHNGRLRRRSL